MAVTSLIINVKFSVSENKIYLMEKIAKHLVSLICFYKDHFSKSSEYYIKNVSLYFLSLGQFF
jgi:hypothetical protein